MRLRTLSITGLLLVLAGAALFYVLTMPQRLDAAAIAPEDSGDVARGETMFWAGGCVSCHAPSKATGEDQLKLGGGDPLVTDFGTFHAPNISPDPTDGIGAWSLADFANAMQRGVAPDGSHLYPAFPYTSYVKMKPQDVADLYAFMKTLPPVSGKAPANELSFPFNIRRGLGLWKLAFMDDGDPIVPLTADTKDPVHRGRYLVEGPGHCGQCHSPRTLFGAGGIDTSRWLAGAPNPEGEGMIPNITPGSKEVGAWSADELAEYFATGFTPEFDSVGGRMVDVQENLAKLSDADRQAIAAYLKAVPPQP
ncbi:cytochrome c [Mangrovicella endophytica]|uniref:cytochrome c n=1 Tax=Mangrovicella endophytica TaxID=2066697 RepID=UPI000C9E4BDF|nr:cytochrome c [Mangrovicella endophytica]